MRGSERARRRPAASNEEEHIVKGRAAGVEARARQKGPLQQRFRERDGGDVIAAAGGGAAVVVAAGDDGGRSAAVVAPRRRVRLVVRRRRRRKLRSDLPRATPTGSVAALNDPPPCDERRPDGRCHLPSSRPLPRASPRRPRDCAVGQRRAIGAACPRNRIPRVLLTSPSFTAGRAVPVCPFSSSARRVRPLRRRVRSRERTSTRSASTASRSTGPSRRSRPSATATST